jgi:hypothetical protein
MVNVREALMQVAENAKQLNEGQFRSRKPTDTTTTSTPETTPTTPTSTPTPTTQSSGSPIGNLMRSAGLLPQKGTPGFDPNTGKATGEITSAPRVTATNAPEATPAERAQANEIKFTNQAAPSATSDAVRATINKQLGEPEAPPPVTSADVAKATPAAPKAAPRPVAPKPSGPTAGEREADRLMALHNAPGGIEVRGGSVTPNPLGPGSVVDRGVTPPGGVEGKLESESGPNKGKKSKVSESTLINAFLKLMEKQSPDMFSEAKKLAKKDYDGDGKVESEKDEVWGSRFKAAKKAGKMEEAKKWCESCKAESGKCSCKKMEESESIFSEEEIAHFEAVMERGAQQNITTRKEKGDRVAETIPTRNLTD